MTLSRLLPLATATGRSLIGLAVRRQLTAYTTQLRGSHTFALLNLFLALPEQRAEHPWPKDLSRLAWQVLAYRSLNDLDFTALRWQRFEVEGRRYLEWAQHRGRGVILCSLHLGAYRRLTWELLQQGERLHVLVDARVAAGFRRQLAAQLERQKVLPSERKELLSRLTVLDAEAPGSTRPILDALRAGGLLLIYLDGNTGATGPGASVPGASGTAVRNELAHTNNVEVDFFGRSITVRRGVCQLAHATGAALVPLFAQWRGGTNPRPAMEFHPPLLVPEGMDRETFCRRGMQHLFRLSEDQIRRRPAQFEQWLHAHRWWLSTSSADRASADRASADRASAGEPRYPAPDQLSENAVHHRFRLDPRHALLLTLGRETLLLDGYRGHLVRGGQLLSATARALRRALSPQELVQRLSKYPAPRVLQTFKDLQHRGLLQYAT